ncbi:MAG: TIR domain-containing protein [Ktedonobacteraceae bacterium]|nr:TIR domain-containing protein [Ktedonobacteraceae bacterium]
MRQQLETHLSLLRRQGLIDDWHDRQIMPGTRRVAEINAHLETAQLILLLISPDFLASDYYYEIELQRALEREKQGKAHVIPIILRPCDWHEAPFAYLSCLPHGGKPITTWDNQDKVLQDITSDIRRIIQPEVSALALAKKPDQNHKTTSPKFSPQSALTSDSKLQRTSLKRTSKKWPLAVLATTITLLLLLTVLVLRPGVIFGGIQSLSPSNGATATATQAARATASNTTTTAAIPSTWKPVMNDKLTAQSHESDWVASTSDSNDTCAFSPNFYEIVKSQLNYCNYGTSSAHNWADLVYSAEMLIHTGSYSGLAFHLRNANYYYFAISTAGDYLLEAHQDNGGQDTFITQGKSQVIHAAYDQWNMLKIVVKGTAITLYINDQNVAAVQDSTFASGTVAVVGGLGKQGAHAYFRNAHIWIPSPSSRG